MKTKLLVFCFVLLACTICRAETDCIQITLANGETETIMLSSKPKLIFDSQQISVIYDGKTISIPLEDGLTVSHKDSKQTDVEEINCQGVYFSISDDGISCYGLSRDESMSLFCGNGTLLKIIEPDASGNASVSLPDSGLYIIRAGEKSFKFYIK